MTSNTYIFRFKILSSKYNLLSFQLAQLFHFHLLDTTETSKDLEHFLCLYLFIFTHFHTPLSCHKSSLLLLYCKSVKSLSLFFLPGPPLSSLALIKLFAFLVPVPWLLTLLKNIPKPHILVTHKINGNHY